MKLIISVIESINSWATPPAREVRSRHHNVVMPRCENIIFNRAQAIKISIKWSRYCTSKFNPQEFVSMAWLEALLACVFPLSSLRREKPVCESHRIVIGAFPAPENIVNKSSVNIK